MVQFLDLSAEIRCLIYHHLFEQTNGKLLVLSREPDHDYSNGPPNDWIADSRQAGLVYGGDTARTETTNSRFLRTCRKIFQEAAPIFYGTNKLCLYAEDNNDIFYWLLDIGEFNRRAIRYLEISWAYGVSIQSGRGNMRHLIELIDDMDDSEEEEIQRRRQQLVSTIQQMERKTVRLIIRTLNFLVSNQDLLSFGIFLPGVDGGDIWDLPNENLYFAEEIFSNSTTNVHACIPDAISKMLGIHTLTIGYTRDIGLAEKIARETGARELIIQTCPEANTLNLSKEEQDMWIGKGWRLEGNKACKTLIEGSVGDEDESSEDTSEDEDQDRGVDGAEDDKPPGAPKAKLQRSRTAKGYSEGGRLMADMVFKEPYGTNAR